MNLQKKYSTIEELIKQKLNREEDTGTLKLMKELKNVKAKGYFTKQEFLKIGMWKSPRPKQRYLRNSQEKILSISKKVMGTKSEKQRIELLTSLDGVSIPTASAILTLIDPENYGVIDIRAWQILYLYGSVRVRPKGRNFNFNNWHSYLKHLRFHARRFQVPVRDIERTIFLHHREIQEGSLY